METLLQLVYTSFVAPHCDETCVMEIVRRGREKNRQLNVTGLLIFDGLCFCQYLEGPKEPTLALMNEIRADRRHIEFLIGQDRESKGPRLFMGASLNYARSRDPDALDTVRTGARSAIALCLHVASSLTIESG